MVLFDWYFCLAILFHDNSSSVKVERSTDVAIDVLSDVDYMYIYSDFIHRRSLSNLNLLMTSDDKVLIYVYPLHYKINVLRLTTVCHFESRLGSFSNLLKNRGSRVEWDCSSTYALMKSTNYIRQRKLCRENWLLIK